MQIRTAPRSRGAVSAKPLTLRLAFSFGVAKGGGLIKRLAVFLCIGSICADAPFVYIEREKFSDNERK